MAASFSIAFIALRTGQQYRSGGPVQAIVVGQGPDPKEWCYALYDLPDLQRLLTAVRRNPDGARHPLDISPAPPPPLTTGGDYRRLGPAPAGLLWPEERADLLSANDLPAATCAALRAALTSQPAAPAENNPRGLPPIDFAMPLRDVVRIVFYERDFQPTDANGDGNALLALDTCRLVLPATAAGATDSPRPAAPPPPLAVEPAFGSSVILFAKPPAAAPVVNAGALFGFAVLGQFRLALNGHAGTGPRETPRGFVRLYAVNAGPGRPLFDDDPQDPKAVPVNPDGVGVGPRFDSMRVGFSTAGWSGSAATSRVYSLAQPGCLGELSRFSRRARDYHPPLLRRGVRAGTGLPATAWASDFPLRGVLADGGIATNATTRELGFRFVKRPDPDTPNGQRQPSRLALRFEAGYWLTGPLKNLGFLPPCPQAWSGAQWHLFAQEQPLDDIDGDLSPRGRLRWVLTARLMDGAAVGGVVLQAINTSVAALQSGLRQAHGGAPLSTLPQLTANPAAPGNLIWHLAGSHIDTAPYNRDLAAGEIANSGFAALEPRFVADMWSADYLPAVGKAGAEKAADKRNIATLYGDVAASFPAMTLAMPAGNVLGYTLRLAAPTAIDTISRQAAPQTSWPSYQPAISAAGPGGPRGMFLGVFVKDISPALTAPVEIALGALALRFAKAGPVTPSLRGLMRLMVTAGATGAAMEALLHFPIADAYPAGQDELPDAARGAPQDPWADPLADPDADADAPLCFMLPAPGAADGQIPAPPVLNDKQSFTLYAVESVAPRRNPSIDLSLVAFVETTPPAPGGALAAAPVPAPPPPPPVTAPAPAPVPAQLPAGTLLVIDTAPFRVAAVRVPALAAAQTDASNQVAVWNGGGGDGLSWRLADDGGVVSLLLPPQVIGEAMEKNRGNDGRLPPDINETMPAAARFGSLTRLDLAPAYSDPRYVEPGWNLRRIMGYPGQRAPGAGLRDLRLELAYGLLTRLTPTDTATRIAELGAAIGAPAPPLSGDGAEVDHYVAACNAMLSVAARRPAIDRLWRGDPLADFVMDRDLQFQLRLPGSGDKASGMTPLRWPFPGAMPPDLKPALAAGFSTDPRDGASFPGGIAWAFESSNILQAVYGNPASSDGRVDNLHLSALGGTGQQRALFDQGRTVIELDTSMGRVHRYALERIGRIGALWNRAKHVIVYERTVAPSAQFYNFDPIGLEQDLLLGRPVLRKVEEYVQILQPSRRFPENGGAVEAAGCLTGVTFGSLLIRVDSRWGGDVRNQGWQVPLWNTAFAAPPNDANNPDDPAFIYPKPHIRLQVMGANGVETGLDVDEPEKLVFYTSVLSGESGDATDTWQPVAGVDFLDLPPPQPASRIPSSADLIDAPMPPAPEHLAGHERLTLALAPSKDAVFIGNGRQSGGPVVKLRNVTIARAVQASGGAHAAARATGVAMAQTVGGIAVAVDGMIGRLHAALAPLLAATPVAPQAVNKAVTAFAGTEIGLGGMLHRALGDIAPVPPCDVPFGPTIADGLAKAAAAQLEKVRDAAASAADALDATATDALNGAASVLAQALRDLATGTLPVATIAGTAAQALRGVGGGIDAATQAAASALGQLTTNAAPFLDAAGVAFGAFDAYATAVANAIRAAAEIAQATPATWAATQNAAAAVAAGAMADAFTSRSKIAKEGAPLALADLPAEAIRLLGGADTSLAAIKALTAEIAQANAPSDEINSQIGALRNVLATALAIESYGDGPITLAKQTLRDVSTAFGKIALPITAANLADAYDQAGLVIDAATRVIAAATRNMEAVTVIPAAPPPSWPSARRRLMGAILAPLNQAMGASRSIRAVSPSHSPGDIAKVTAADIEKLDHMAKAVQKPLQKYADDIEPKIDAALELAATYPMASNAFSAVIDPIAGLPGRVLANVKECFAGMSRFVDAAEDIQQATVATLADIIANTQQNIVSQQAALRAGVTSLRAQIGQQIAQAQSAVLDDQTGYVTSLANKIADGAGGAIGGFAAALPADPDLLTAMLTGHPSVANLQTDLQQKIADAVSAGAGAGAAALMAAVQDATAQVSRRLQDSLGGYVASVHGALSDALGVDPVDAASQAQRVFQEGSDTLRLLRAVGDPPTANMLGFNRPQVAYVFQEANQFVNMTPAISLVNRAAGAAAAADNLLSTFGVRLPLSAIGAQLMPDALKDLDISALMPDFAGIRLDGLFKNLTFPSLSDRDAVKIAHGFDAADKSAWLQADIDVPFDDTAPLMDFGPVQILVDNARFTSTARIVAGPGGAQKSLVGQIAGDWRVACAGQTLISFLRTGLSFDHTGHLKFEIQPDRVELAETLQFLSELMAEFTGAGGLQVLPYLDGVAAVLDMVLPPVQTGAFGISDLSLHVLFAITALPEFEIVTELGLGSKLAPFTLNVTLLNGGGFITSRLRYVPARQPALLDFSLEIGIAAGVGLGFTLGVVSGGVWLQIGCAVALNWSTGPGGSTTAVSAFLLLRGCVDVAGLITVSLSLILEITYDGARMIGSGALHIRVKISIFYTVSVSEHVQYSFIGGQKSAGRSYAGSYA